MRRAAVLAIVLCACASSRQTITCGDPFNGALTEEALIDRFGREHVQTKTLELGEGQTQKGTVVDGLEIVWKDPVRRRSPRYVRIPSTSNARTYESVRIGTDLKTLERINGTPFQLTGFAWDYEGTVLSWNNGRLARDTGSVCRLIVRLAAPRTLTPEQQSARSRLIGDREFSSTSADMQTLNPRVYEILLSFD